MKRLTVSCQEGLRKQMLEVKDVSKKYKKSGLFSNEKQLILNNVNLTINDNECMGIIGESGSGKSTLARQILGIESPDSGAILYNGLTVRNRSTRNGHMSAVFQDYTSSIDPYYTVEKALAEPMKLLKKYEKEEIRKKSIELLEQVGLNESYMVKYPHELSGGEAQRVCIARAISTEPEFLLLDEAISSLDASVQFQVLELLKKLKEDLSLSYLFITHDIQAAVFLCDRIAFFSKGEVVEVVDVNDINKVQNEYSRKLLNSVMMF